MLVEGGKRAYSKWGSVCSIIGFTERIGGFLEENLEYVRRLSRAGVAVELHVYPGTPHCSVLETSRPLEVSRVALAAGRNNREALRRALHG